MKVRKKILSVLFWSVLAAAFIGPGTVVTATKAGIYYNFQLLWTLVFSTFATLFLQEASARITIHTQMNLGEAIAKQFEGKASKSFVLFIIIVAIILGCAAYETGNILGAVAGLTLVFDVPTYYFVGGIGILAVIIFSLRSIDLIARLMGTVVFLMGAAFFYTSISLSPNWGEVISGSFVPSIPKSIPNAPVGIIILSLVGTTVIPYDLFLGSGALDKKQSIKDMRFGLAIAIILGGIISMSIMGIGNAVTEDMTEQARANISFETMPEFYALIRNSLEYDLGKSALYVFGFGMFAAGFSSAVTSPLASAITAKSLFSNKHNKAKWNDNALYFKIVSASVLAVGLILGFLKIQPLPAIIIAQAFNGLILPLIAIFLVYVVNDSKIMGKENINGWMSNVMLAIVLWVTMLLGFFQISKAVTKALNIVLPEENTLLIPIIIGSAILSILILFTIYRNRLRNLRLEQENASQN